MPIVLKKIIPTADHIFVDAPDKILEKETGSGLVIPPSDKEKQQPIICIVAEVGPDTKLVGKGDEIVIAEYGFDPIEINGKNYLVGKEENVQAILKPIEKKENGDSANA